MTIVVVDATRCYHHWIFIRNSADLLQGTVIRWVSWADKAKEILTRKGIWQAA